MPVGVQLVQAPGAIGPVDHEPGLLQHLQVLGHRRPGDRQLRRDLADGAWAVSQELEHGATGRVAERREAVNLVSSH